MDLELKNLNCLSFLILPYLLIFIIFRKKYISIVELPTHHDQGLQQGVPGGGELVHVRQEDVEGESKSHNKDDENHQHLEKRIQDVVKNRDIFSNPRKLSINIISH